ncbi:hypothetical protein ANTHELSMS3_00446 [Antarctobacter heliothermus]|uniref:Uncharacterized protein n=1 Tax=Antarctobacter heliothermus TaxID=74033 RepID=A0A222DYZ5_9RHOB|nr:hypothetical protein ANTHELSMS3_00446 [Antarctobacter heliothermus]
MGSPPFAPMPGERVQSVLAQRLAVSDYCSGISRFNKKGRPFRAARFGHENFSNQRFIHPDTGEKRRAGRGYTHRCSHTGAS